MISVKARRVVIESIVKVSRLVSYKGKIVVEIRNTFLYVNTTMVSSDTQQPGTVGFAITRFNFKFFGNKITERFANTHLSSSLISQSISVYVRASSNNGK